MTTRKDSVPFLLLYLHLSAPSCYHISIPTNPRRLSLYCLYKSTFTIKTLSPSSTPYLYPYTVTDHISPATSVLRTWLTLFISKLLIRNVSLLPLALIPCRRLHRSPLGRLLTQWFWFTPLCKFFPFHNLS